MTTVTRRLMLTALLGALIGTTAGCNIAALSYFLTPEQRHDAKIRHLASSDHKRNPKVLILTYSGAGEIPADFIHADRQLADLLTRNLEEMAKASDETLAVIPPRKVEEFKNANPDWRQMDLAAVGRRFGADYVIYLEVNSLGLYERGSGNSLYRGRANLLVSLVDVARPDDTPVQDTYTTIFPSDAQGPVPAGMDVQPMHFRQLFLTHVAKQLSWYFSKYPRSDVRLMERAF